MILFYLGFLCRFYRAIILPISESISSAFNLFYFILFSKGLDDLTLHDKARIIGCQSNLGLITVQKLKGSDHQASSLFILPVFKSLLYIALVLQFSPSVFQYLRDLKRNSICKKYQHLILFLLHQHFSTIRNSVKQCLWTFILGQRSTFIVPILLIHFWSLPEQLNGEKNISL